jgi:hypothetical protein
MRLIDTGREVKMFTAKERVFLAIIMTLFAVGILAMALGFSRTGSVFSQPGGYTQQDLESARASGDVLSDFGMVAIQLGILVGYTWLLYEQGLFSAFAEKRYDRLAGAAYGVGIAALILWRPYTVRTALGFSALTLLYVGAHMWLRPRNLEWETRDKATYVVLTALALTALAGALLLILLR